MKIKLLTLTLSLFSSLLAVSIEPEQTPVQSLEEKVSLEKSPQQTFETTFHFAPTKRPALERPTFKEEAIDILKHGWGRRYPNAAKIVGITAVGVLGYLIYKNPFNRDLSNMPREIFLDSIFGCDGILHTMVCRCF